MLALGRVPTTPIPLKRELIQFRGRSRISHHIYHQFIVVHYVNDLESLTEIKYQHTSFHFENSQSRYVFIPLSVECKQCLEPIRASN